MKGRSKLTNYFGCSTMKKCIGIYEVLLLVFIFVPTANAALVTLDWQAAGDGGLTFDTATNLEWLDLTYTAGQSYNEVSGELGEGGAFAGFRYATVDDVATLFSDAGIPDVGARTAANFEPVNDLLRLVGRLRPLAGGSFSYAITGTSAGANQQYYSLLQVVLPAPPFVGEAQTALCCIGTDEVSSDTGSWLVRSAAVSEPATWFLLGSGMLLSTWAGSRRTSRHHGVSKRP